MKLVEKIVNKVLDKIFGINNEKDYVLCSKKEMNVALIQKDNLLKKGEYEIRIDAQHYPLSIIGKHNVIRAFYTFNNHYSSLGTKLASIELMNKKLMEESEQKTDYKIKYINEKYKVKNMGLNCPIRLNKENHNEIFVNVPYLKSCSGQEILASLIFARNEAKLYQQEQSDAKTIDNKYLFQKNHFIDMTNERLINLFENSNDEIAYFALALVCNQENYNEYKISREKSIEMLDDNIGLVKYEEGAHNLIKAQIVKIKNMEETLKIITKDKSFNVYMEKVMNYLDLDKKYIISPENDLSEVKEQVKKQDEEIDKQFNKK